MPSRKPDDEKRLGSLRRNDSQGPRVVMASGRSFWPTEEAARPLWGTRHRCCSCRRRDTVWGFGALARRTGEFDEASVRRPRFWERRRWPSGDRCPHAPGGGAVAAKNHALAAVQPGCSQPSLESPSWTSMGTSVFAQVSGDKYSSSEQRTVESGCCGCCAWQAGRDC